MKNQKNKKIDKNNVKASSTKKLDVEKSDAIEEDETVPETLTSETDMSSFPSIPHFPFSPQIHSDDIKLSGDSCSSFIRHHVIITEKLDGGNCCLY